MSYYDNHAEDCDGTECVTYECQLLNRDESPEVAAVIKLWNDEGGWLPGAAYVRLAEALGVDPDRLTHYEKGKGRHYAEEGHRPQTWEDSVRAGNRCKDPMCACSTIPTDNGGN